MLARNRKVNNDNRTSSRRSVAIGIFSDIGKILLELELELLVTGFPPSSEASLSRSARSRASRSMFSERKLPYTMSSIEIRHADTLQTKQYLVL